MKKEKRAARRNRERPNRGPSPEVQPKDRLPMVRRTELICALALTALIVFLHVYRARYAGALWRDEVGAFNVATSPSFSQAWSSLVYESFPLLPFGVFRMWTGISWLGGGDTSLRVLGALIGVGALAALWLNQRLLGYQVPVLSLVFFGLNPAVIRWGDSFRGYGLGSLLMLLTYAFVWRVVESATPRRVVLAAVVAILSVQCLYQNAFLLFAICLGGSLVCLRRRMWKRMLLVLGIGAISALSLIPYVPIITKAQGNLLVFQVSSAVPQILGELATVLSSGHDLVLWAALILSAIGILATGYLITLAPNHRAGDVRLDLAIFSSTVLLLGTPLFIFFSKSASLPINPWHCIVWVGAIAVSMDILIGLVTTTVPRRIGRLAIALLLAAVTIPLAWTQLQLRQTNVDIIASTLQQKASPGDFVIVNPFWNGITFQHYYRGNTAWTTIPPLQDHGLHRYDLIKEKMTAANPVQPIVDALTKTLSSGNRVWWVGGFEVPPKGQHPPALPPAPNGPSGWQGGPYLRVWTVQLGEFLQSHVTEGEQLNLPIDQPVFPAENLRILMFKGWRP